MFSIDKISKNVQDRSETSQIHDFDPNIPYIFSKDGPILFSAPHSMPLDRVNFAAGCKKCNHLRERFAANIALKFATEIKKYTGTNASLAIWDPRAKKSKNNIDPN